MQGEGFLQERLWSFDGGWRGEGVLGVTREVEDFDGGARGEKLLDQFVAAEAGHDNVGDDEVDGIGVAGGEGECGMTVGGFEDAIAAGLEGFADELAYGIFVLD